MCFIILHLAVLPNKLSPVPLLPSSGLRALHLTPCSPPPPPPPYRYWSYPINTYSFPDLAYLDATVPDISRSETSVKLSWGVAGPGAPLAPSWFVTRFTFYMSVATQVCVGWVGEGGGSEGRER